MGISRSGDSRRRFAGGAVGEEQPSASSRESRNAIGVSNEVGRSRSCSQLLIAARTKIPQELPSSCSGPDYTQITVSI